MILNYFDIQGVVMPFLDGWPVEWGQIPTMPSRVCRYRDSLMGNGIEFRSLLIWEWEEPTEVDLHVVIPSESAPYLAFQRVDYKLRIIEIKVDRAQWYARMREYLVMYGQPQRGRKV